MRTVYGLLASLQLCIGWTADELPTGGHQLGYKSHHQGKGDRECFEGDSPRGLPQRLSKEPVSGPVTESA